MVMMLTKYTQTYILPSPHYILTSPHYILTPRSIFSLPATGGTTNTLENRAGQYAWGFVKPFNGLNELKVSAKAVAGMEGVGKHGHQAMTDALEQRFFAAPMVSVKFLGCSTQLWL
jgi:hypothetical protein